MNRQEAVIKIEKMNRLSKQLTYWEELGAPFKLDVLDSSITEYGRWAIDLRVFLKLNPIEELMDRVLQMPDVSRLKNYLSVNKENLETDIYASLQKYVEVISDMKDEFQTIKLTAKGDYRHLPDSLANKKGKELMMRCVEAGFLNEEFKPEKGTDKSVLKVIAFAVSKCMGFRIRFRWSCFDELWGKGKGKICGEHLSIKNKSQYDIITMLYPEVDFKELFEPQYNLKFECDKSLSKIKQMYNALYNGRYIDKETTYNQFLGIFGKSRCSTPVNWIREQRLLSYLVYCAFSSTNKNFWRITESRFLINGDTPHRPSLSTGIQALIRENRLDKYDKTIIEIVNSFNNN